MCNGAGQKKIQHFIEKMPSFINGKMDKAIFPSYHRAGMNVFYPKPGFFDAVFQFCNLMINAEFLIMKDKCNQIIRRALSDLPKTPGFINEYAEFIHEDFPKIIDRIIR